MVNFWTYQPSDSVKTIASRAMLTDAGVFTLYATHPSIDDSQTFNAECDRKEQNTAILGCYTNDRIYIYDISDKRLDGIKEVTAAHEMLHAVYQRLSPDEKTKIDKLVEDEYKNLSANPDFAERMAFYARTEPGERDNELHSIIGTEVRTISPALEAHYAKYFSNRGELLNLYEGYNTVFTKLSEQTKQLAAQLDSEGKKIQSDSDSYNRAVKQLNADIISFNQRAASGDFSSQAVFNSQRQQLQQRVASVSASRTAINTAIERYDSLRQQYNDTVTQTQDLYKSIDSSLAPAPKV